jgi:hypothetical protein
MMDAAIAKTNVGQNRVPEMYSLSLILRILVHNEMKSALYNLFLLGTDL